ncbi:DUF4465 domain-containing protein [Prevotella falsenii]|uniref:DUF4465 domain-containing protein n=1 Tax=Prevotella falsenii TaxID=515414 RepID=UPI0018DE3787|nr:DUF4465 domain-containing protein [Prevotella falsenii]
MKKVLFSLAVICSMTASADNTLVIVKADGTTIVCSENLKFEQTGNTLTFAGNAIVEGDMIKRNIVKNTTVGFEDCTFAQGKHNNIVSGKVTTYTEAGIDFKNQEKYTYFSGVVVSDASEVSKWESEHPGVASGNKVITTDESKPAGAEGTSKYAIMRYDDYLTGKSNGEKPEFAFNDGTEHAMVSMMVNNTAEIWQKCKIGYYSKPAFKEGDFYEAVFTGYDAAGKETGKVVVPMADYRDGKTYICGEWTQVDLSPLGKVNKVSLSHQASDSFDNLTSSSFAVCIDNLIFK